MLLRPEKPSHDGRETSGGAKNNTRERHQLTHTLQDSRREVRSHQDVHSWAPVQAGAGLEGKYRHPPPSFTILVEERKERPTSFWLRFFKLLLFLEYQSRVDRQQDAVSRDLGRAEPLLSEE